MLRAIIRHKHRDQNNGLEIDEFETLDFDSEVLEEVLRSGGYSESGYDYWTVVGVQILASPAETGESDG